MEPSLRRLLSHAEGVSAVQSRVLEDGGSIYMKRAMQQSTELKQLLLRDVLQVESIWKSCFYVSVGNVLVT